MAKSADLLKSFSAIRCKIPFSTVNLSISWALMGSVIGDFNNGMAFKRALTILKQFCSKSKR